MNLFDMERNPTVKQRLQGETNMSFMPFAERVPGRDSFRYTPIFLTNEERAKATKAKAKRKASKKARKQSRAK